MDSEPTAPPAFPAGDLTRSDSTGLPSDPAASTTSTSYASDDILPPANTQLGSPLPLLSPPDKALKDPMSSSASAEPNSATLPVPENAKSRLLPVPATTINHANPSQTSFVLSDAGDNCGGETEGLASEIATADVSIAADGSFVQTSSALAARELKKCYDKILGVGQGVQGVVRSPYIISAVQDEFGSSVFRIGHRITHESTADDMTSPDLPSPYTPGHAVGPRRKARLSVHDFLPSSMFKSSIDSTVSRNALTAVLGSGSTPPANTSSTSPPHIRRKLRKTRSNTDLHLRGTSSPPHVGSSTSGDNSGPLSPPPRSESFSIEIRDEVTAGADAFSQVLGWSSELSTELASSSRKAVKSSVPPSEDSADSSTASVTAGSTTEAPKSRRPSISTSAALSGTAGDTSNAPFGDNVRYTPPMRRSAIFLASQQPQLREMQSFESVLTAKVGDDYEGTPGTPKSKSTAPGKDQSTTFLAVKSQTRFSTAVFDVLQTYTGLPMPSALLSAPPTGATIKMSTTDSPNPKDDPRFVIWGEVQSERMFVDDASVSHSQSSHTDLPNSTSSVVSGSRSRKRSNTRPPHLSNDAAQLLANSESMPQTVMIAATVERWIAQLTSELNYDELLNFLLTYRTYISSVDLCHLLICRFHWALETPSSKQDDMVRRIIRVRTFIAIRYWLLTFFREDFLPNTELCLLFASWLNTLFRDPALKRHTDALSIVRKLKKIVRECKAAHSRHGRTGVGRPSMDSRTIPYSSVNGVMGDLVQSSRSDEPNKKNGGEHQDVEIDDSDVDLDFSFVANNHYAEASTGLGSPPVSPTNDSLHQPTIASPSSHGRSPATPSANSILLSQPLSMTILGHVKSTKPGTDTPLTQTPTSLPVQHSAISRAFVNTIGRLGRWKRVLNARSNVPAPHCGDVSSFDLELNATGDLLAVRGGVEEYLKMLNLSPSPVLGIRPQESNRPSASNSRQPTLPPGLTSSSEGGAAPHKHTLKSPKSLAVHLSALDEEAGVAETLDKAPQQSRDSYDSFLTSEITDEADQLSLPASPPSGWVPDVVSLDDYDLSDSGSSSQSSTRARRLPRRLPLRRDFQFVRRSIESVSSMGIRSQSSVTSSINIGSGSGSVRSQHSSASGGRQLATSHFHQWQIELISDDEEEAGDVEAALRRLEGQIDLDRQREKDMKVGRWLKTASKRAHRDSVSSIHSGSQFLELEDEEDTGHHTPENEDVTVSVNSVRSSALGPTSLAVKNVASSAEISYSDSTSATTHVTDLAHIPQSTVQRDRSGSTSSTQVSIQSHPTSRPTSSAGMVRRPSLLGRTSRPPALSKFVSPSVPTAHRSFVLMHRSETLAQQFAIIEAELFAKIKFEELISHQWGQSPEDVNVRDWVQFVKERARLKNVGKPPFDSAVLAKLSAILALRARFDLLVNFTSSEILLTHPNERTMVVEKFIRVAWKAYRHNNFSTLVSLIAGLQTRWVNQAMGRQWHKVGIWEQRVFDDLKKFTSRPGTFKYLRNATAALIDARPLHVGVQDSGSISGAAVGAITSSKSKACEMRDASACVPFLGVYLAQLYEHERLPDFIDPTAPAEPVLIDGDTGTLSPPSHSEVFFNLQPLPPELSLEPLINVQKQRLIAGVIKSFVAGQHLATNIRFEVDQNCYQKCFRLRSLEPDALHSIAKSFTDS